MPEKNPTSVCGARNKQTGDPCQHHAGWGTTHLGYGLCKMHGGSTPTHKKRAAMLEAADMPIVMGMPAETEPHDAVMRAIWIANGKVNYCWHNIALLSTKEELALAVPSDDMRYWLRKRDEAADSLVRTSKIAHDMGISERQVAVAERLGSIVGQLLRDVLGELGLTAAQQTRAPEVVERHLALVAGQVV